jgi:hypothetical protein
MTLELIVLLPPLLIPSKLRNCHIQVYTINMACIFGMSDGYGKKRRVRINFHQNSISDKRISGLSHPCYPLPSPLLMGSDHRRQLHLSENVFISGKSNPFKILLTQSSQTTDIMVSEPGQRLGFNNQAFELCDGRE